jgi:hypothetical protein
MPWFHRLLRELFHQDLFHYAQSHRHSELAAAWSKGAWLLLRLAADLGVVHVMLVLQACREPE